MKIFMCSLLFLFGINHVLKGQQLNINTKLNIKSITGGKLRFKSLKSNKATVIVFYSPECPICISMSKTLRDLSDSFTTKGVQFYLIYPGNYYSLSVLKKFQKNYLLKMDGFRDDHNQLVHILGATVNPEAFVISPDGNIAYSGKIDNWFEDVGKRRSVVTEFYLKDALQALLKNEHPAIRKTEPVGCFIN